MSMASRDGNHVKIQAIWRLGRPGRGGAVLAGDVKRVAKSAERAQPLHER
jgi:hypothetical protein